MANPTELATGNLRKLLVEYSTPAIAAMLTQSLYNIIDGIFIGQGVGALAIAGLAITMPIMNLSAAFGAMVGAGGGTLTSIRMGQQDLESATKVLGNVIIMNVILGCLFSLFGLIFIDDLLRLFGASDDTLPYARDFMVVILIGNPITHLYLGLNDIIRATGYPRKSMLITMSTIVINIILAPLFIFVFQWGIRGAALATVLSQTVAFLVEIRHFINPSSFIHFTKGYMKFSKKICSDIISIGMAPFIMNACTCIIVIIINNQLQKYDGDMAVGAYGIVNRLLMLFAMAIMGLNKGLQPIAGYNYGAQIYSRVYKVLRITIVIATAIMTFAFIIGEFFPYYLVRIFTSGNETELINLSVIGFRVMVAAFPIVGFQMVTSNFFQSIGKAKKAVVLSSTRQMLFLIPFLLILPQYFGTMGVWMSMPLSDLTSTIIAVILLRAEIRDMKKLQDKPFVVTE